MRLELSPREKNLVEFVGFILFLLFESWIGFDEFIYQTIRAIGYSIRSMGIHAIPRLVSWDIKGLKWAVQFSPWNTPNMTLVSMFV